MQCPTVSASASLQESRDRTDGYDLSLGWMGTDGHQGAAQIHKRRAVDPEQSDCGSACGCEPDNA